MPETSTSQVRIDANRVNSQKSTGPKTEEGKARVAQNGVKHGLSSARLIVRPDEKEEFTTFLNELIQSFQPKGGAERIFFDQMTDAAWNLRRVAKLESELYIRAGGDPLITEDEAIYRNAMGLLRYKIAHDRIYHKAYKQFTALPNHRLNRENAVAQNHETPAEAPPTPATNQTQEAIRAAAQQCMNEVDREIAATKDFIGSFLRAAKIPGR